MVPACAHHRASGRSRSCPRDTRTPGRPVRGTAGGGQRGGSAQAPRLHRPRPQGPCPHPLHLWGGADPGGWEGPRLHGRLRPRGLLLGDRGRPPHAVCLLARECERRAPLVCSDLGTKFKDFKSTSWRAFKSWSSAQLPVVSFLWSPPLHLRRGPRSPA